jgi:hypothetical protein
MSNSNRTSDFIPAEEDNGAYGANGFQDFVPAPEPEYHPEVEQEVVEATPEETPLVVETPIPEPLDPNYVPDVDNEVIETPTEDVPTTEEVVVEDQPTPTNEEIVNG